MSMCSGRWNGEQADIAISVSLMISMISIVISITVQSLKIIKRAEQMIGGAAFHVFYKFSEPPSKINIALSNSY